MTSTVKVLIVDDQVLIRAGIAAILRAAPGYEVVGEAQDGNEAVTMAELTRPDVVLMDIRMPELDGIAATRRILGASPVSGPGPAGPGQENKVRDPNRKPPRILILTTFDLDEYVYKALRAGASGFVLKDTPPERLLAALKAVADGDTLFSPTVTQRLVQAFCAVAGDENPGGLPGAAAGGVRAPRPDADTAAERAALAALTARETDVLRLVATGLSNGEIAERLVVSEGTVKTHLNRSMAKLNLSSRAQVVVLAYESGLVVPGQPQAAQPAATTGTAPTPTAPSRPGGVRYPAGRAA